VFRFDGRVSPVGGDGLARLNYPVMIAAIAEHFGDIRNFGQHGTINVCDLKPLLCKRFADYWSPEVVWHPVAGQDRLGYVRHEYYGLIKIKFACPPDGDLHEAWIIMPEGHPWAYDENGGVEVNAEEFITGVKRGVSCAIHLDHTPSVARPVVFGSHFGHMALVTNSASVPPHPIRQ
jgi:hypothetical protein